MAFMRRLSVRTVIIFLALIVAAGMSVYIAGASTDEWTDYAHMDWYRDQPVDPGFTIRTAEELAGVAVLVNSGEANGFAGKALMIDNDIDLSAHDWVPIGTEEHPFRGTLFAGGGNVQIDGLKLTGSYRHVGLFGKVVDASIGGLTIAGTGEYNISVTTDVYAGSVVGEMKGLTEVYNIVNELEMTVESGARRAYVGGIVGFGEYKVSNSSNHADIQVSGNAYAGGIIGVSSTEGLELKKADNQGNVTADGEGGADAYAGGLIGVVQGSLAMHDDDTPILNSGAITVLNGRYSFAGGIMGMIAAADLTYSANTVNTGAVRIDAPSGAGSSAGGLVGAITASQANAVNISFTNKGTVTNHGGNEVHTGGLAGLLQNGWTWTGDSANDAAITASGTENVFTGGLIGKTTGDLSFSGTANNTVNGMIQVAPGVLAGSPDEAYTGGLIGFSSDRVFVENQAAGGFENSAGIQVTGGSGLYTGGLLANHTYTSTAGVPTNGTSLGAITVMGDDKLYTGGFIGMLPADAADQAMQAASYSGTMMVTATASAADAIAATGGIIGYYEGNGEVSALNSLVFRGALVVSGGEHAYTGGIVGYAADVLLTGAEAGNTLEAYASITSDGQVGGVAGFLSGTVDRANVSNLSLKVTSQGGYAGGIAGKAQGDIIDATVGIASGEAMDSVRFEADAADALGGDDQLTAGGIVGENDGPLHIRGASRVDNIALLTTVDESEYTFGGAAGSLTDAARIGEAEVPVVVKDVQLIVNASSSDIGGAIGRNDALELYVTTEDIQIEAMGADLRVGGIIGLNTAEMREATTSLHALRPTLSGSGDQARIGGIAGENHGVLLKSTAQDGSLTVTGTSNSAGGAVGRNTGRLQQLEAINMSIQAQAAGATVGGIAGRSEPAIDAGAPPMMENVYVKQQGAALILVTQPQVQAGGIVGYAFDTTITDPSVTALTPEQVVISASAASVRAGGIAGSMENGTISGDEEQTNVGNLLLTLSNGTADSYAGGIVGYSDKTKLDQLVLKTALITLNGTDSMAGGAAGFYLGSETAIISDVYLESISLRAMPTAARAKVGGMAGVIEQRPGQDPVADPNTGISTLQNNRIIGNLTNPNSPVIDVRSPQAIAGGLVGENRALIANNSVIDRIALTASGNESIIGGHTGVNRSAGKLYYTYANARLTTAGEGTKAGGLVGYNEGSIIASYVDTDLTGAARGTENQWTPLGGLVGRNNGDIDSSYSVSKVTSNGVYTIVGGLVGAHESGSIHNSYAGRDVAANAGSSYAGGFAGRIVNGTVSTSYSAANVTAVSGSYAGGFAGRYDNESKELLSKNYYLKDEAVHLNKDLPDFAEGNHRWLNVPARLSTLLASTLRDRSAFPSLSGWDFTTMWRYGSLNADYLYPELIRSPNSGGGDGGSTVNADVAWYTHDPLKIIYEIDTEAELSGLASIVNGTVLGVERFDFAGREIRVMRPIHVQSAQWSPIGASEASPFRGTFKGNGHLIDGYAITETAGQGFAGLFGVIEAGGRVENVKLEPLSIAGTNIAGALAAVNRGMVLDSEVYLGDGIKISGQTVGGVFGANTGSVAGIKLTSASGAAVEVTIDEGTAGGIIGENTTDITVQSFDGFTYQGIVTSQVPNAVLGGVIGKQSADFTNIEVPLQMKVAADGANVIAGGVIGHYASGTMADMDVLLSGSIEMSGASSVAGGVVGTSAPGHRMNQVTITSARPDAVLRGNGTVGGIVGEKTGQGANAWDLEELKLTKVEIGSFADSAHTVIGGIAGALVDSAVRGASFEGKLTPLGERVTLGGIAGTARDSLLYQAESITDVEFTAHSGASVLGGIVGSLSASDTNQAYDFGTMIPMYVGMYDVKSHSATLKLTHTGLTAEVVAGGLAGKNEGASVYFSESSAALEASGFRSATLGGLVGDSTGIMVQSEAGGAILAEDNTSNRIGGVVGIAEGGEIHYTHVKSPNGESIIARGTVTRLPALPEVYAGGFAGVLNQVKLTNVTADISVDVTSDNLEDSLYAGGFAGIMGNNATLADGSIDQAYAKGAVHVDGMTIALAGGFAGSINRFTLTNTYASGDVANAGFDTRSGGFAAEIERRAVVRDAYAAQSSIAAKGVNNATRAYAAGFAAYSEGLIESVYAHASSITMDVSGASTYRGALVGYLFRDGVVTDSTHAADLDAIGYSLGTSNQLVRQEQLASLKLSEWYLVDDASFLMNAGPEFQVMNTDQLFASVRLTNVSTGLEYLQLFDRGAAAQLGGNTVLVADIEVNGFVWRPYEEFTRVFDGQGHTISGLSVADSTSASVGFMTASAGTIRNVQFVESEITAGEAASVGIVAGIQRAGGVIEQVDVQGSVTGGETAGMIVGKNEGEIAESSASGIVEGGTHAGGLAGSNAAGAVIHNSEASGAVTGTGVVGGIAGTNEGEIRESFSSNEVHGVTAGGIVGDNKAAGTIRTVFSYSDVKAAGADARAGGIAGDSSGLIKTSYASGRIVADGEQFARAGGIAGYAIDGTIQDVMSFGEAVATIAGKVSKGKSWFGGIAGQKLEAAAVAVAIYNQQMLRDHVAYYDHEGLRIQAVALASAGLSAETLTSGMLPDGFDNAAWSAAAGFFPQLLYFAEEPASKLSTAAVVMAPEDRVYQITKGFHATLDADVSWTSADAAFSAEASTVRGELVHEGDAVITVTVQDRSRLIMINHAAPPFEQHADAPSFVNAPQAFTGQATIELSTEEPGAVIYYTLDGSQPGTSSLMYTGPIEISETTTLQAVTAAVDLGLSETLTGTWQKNTPGGGGGGGFVPAPPAPPVKPPVKPIVEVSVGDTELSIDSSKPITLARNSKLTLTVPEGVTVYYTTDGSRPTKDSLVYTGELLITRSMSVKLITNTDDTVIAMEYEVAPAAFDIKPDAPQIRYMSGYTDGRFAPDEAITRYELISSLAPLLEIEDVPLGTLLNDVNAAHEEYVAKFDSAGLVTGYPDGTFGGSKGLKRSEMIVILTRMLKLEVSESENAEFTDMAGHWSTPYVRAFKDAGYIQGYPDGTFRPEQEITRAETAVLINKLIGKTALGGEALIQFADLTPAHWAYDDIMSAVR